MSIGKIGFAFASKSIAPLRAIGTAALGWQIKGLENRAEMLSVFDGHYAKISALAGIPFEEVRGRALAAWVGYDGLLAYGDFLDHAARMCSRGQPPEWLMGGVR